MFKDVNFLNLQFLPKDSEASVVFFSKHARATKGYIKIWVENRNQSAQTTVKHSVLGLGGCKRYVLRGFLDVKNHRKPQRMVPARTTVKHSVLGLGGRLRADFSINEKIPRKVIVG